MNTKLTIFGFPRSGTKLLASIYEQQGYHNFGEFFNPFSTSIVENLPIPKSARLSIEEQKAEQNRREKISTVSNYVIKNRIVKDRYSKFKNFIDLEPSIVTCWMSDIQFMSTLLPAMGDRFILCPRRKNKLDQLLSYCVSKHNNNFDGEIISKPVVVDIVFLDNTFCHFYKTERLQDTFVKLDMGRYIDFDLLITGQEDLGFDYKVTTKDQHTDLESLIINIDEVKNRIEELKNFSQMF